MIHEHARDFAVAMLLVLAALLVATIAGVQNGRIPVAVQSVHADEPLTSATGNAGGTDNPSVGARPPSGASY